MGKTNLPRKKKYNLKGYMFEKFSPLRNYGMDVRFSGNNGKMMGRCTWDDL